MKTREEMITMICDLFFDAYIAGCKDDSDSFTRVRAQRDKIYDAVVELYAELEHESYNREQIQFEYRKVLEAHDEDMADKNREIDSLRDQVRSQQATIRKLTHTIDFDDIPDDAMMFSEQDLPFPDVEEMVPAEEVEGSEE